MSAIATAVLVTITEDGEVEHLSLPVAVAEAIVAAERARRAGVAAAEGRSHAMAGEAMGRHGSGAPGSAESRPAAETTPWEALEATEGIMP